MPLRRRDESDVCEGSDTTLTSTNFSFSSPGPELCSCGGLATAEPSTRFTLGLSLVVFVAVVSIKDVSFPLACASFFVTITTALRLQ